MKDGLIGSHIRVTVSDPWEFQVENGSASFNAIVEREKEAAMLIRADTPIKSGEIVSTYWLITSRHKDSDFLSLSAEVPLACNGIPVPQKHFKEAQNLDMSWWRGGGAVVGSIVLI